jgi:hypothetical protein
MSNNTQTKNQLIRYINEQLKNFLEGDLFDQTDNPLRNKAWDQMGDDLWRHFRVEIYNGLEKLIFENKRR